MRLSHQGIRVLAVFVADPKRQLAGCDLAKATGIGPGTLYPLLARFESEKLLTSEWENLQPSEAKRPRKRFYTITPHGQNTAHGVLRDLSAEGRFAWT